MAIKGTTNTQAKQVPPSKGTSKAPSIPSVTKQTNGNGKTVPLGNVDAAAVTNDEAFTEALELVLSSGEEVKRGPCIVAEIIRNDMPPTGNDPWSSGVLSKPYPKTEPKDFSNSKSALRIDDLVAWHPKASRQTDKYKRGDVTGSYWGDWVDALPSSQCYRNLMAMCRCFTEKAGTVNPKDCQPIVECMGEQYVLAEKDDKDFSHCPARENIPEGAIVLSDMANDQSLGGVSGVDAIRIRAEDRLKETLRVVHRAVEIIHAVQLVNDMDGGTVHTRLGCQFKREADGSVSRGRKPIEIGQRVKDAESGETTLTNNRLISVGELLGFNVVKAAAKGGKLTDLVASGRTERASRKAGETGKNTLSPDQVKVIATASDAVMYLDELAAWRERSEEATTALLLAAKDDDVAWTIYEAYRLIEPVASSIGAKRYQEIDAKRDAADKAEQQAEQTKAA